jgi:hypothetical protein
MENPLKRVIVVILTVTPAILAGWRFDAAKIGQVQTDQCDSDHVQGVGVRSEIAASIMHGRPLADCPGKAGFQGADAAALLDFRPRRISRQSGSIVRTPL